PLTPDWVNIDHRGETAFGADELFAYLRAGRDADQDTTTYIEAVHRLSDLGAVITYAANETSREGFDAEWRGVTVLIIEGEMIKRTEIFDDADFDAALARFDELQLRTTRLENAAGRAIERYLTHFAAREWGALAGIVAEDIRNDDQRRTVNAGNRHGRDAEIASLRASADAGFAYMTSTVMATRGDRLALALVSGHSQGPEGFLNPALGVAEINSDHQIAAIVVFDADDFDAAVAELDARYMTGEAVPHAQQWSVITQAMAALNRRELPATTPDWATVDHRSGQSFEPGDLPALLANWNDTPHVSNFIEAVHRLNDVGAVVRSASSETSHAGLTAEWRVICVITINGDLINRSEIFDDSDLDAALARFDELQPRAPQLENAASQVLERLSVDFSARDWNAIAEVMAENVIADDRRSVVNAPILRGRDAELANLRTFADLGVTHMEYTVIANRGERIVLARASSRIAGADSFQAEMLAVFETNFDNQIAAVVLFDMNDFDAATAELDTRYLAGEAAPYAQTWSVIKEAYAAFNRREVPATTPDWVSLDYRRGAAFAPGDLIAYIQAAWADSPDTKIYIEAVHRLSDIGGVVTHVARGISQVGFDAEWRDVSLLMHVGDLTSRCEIFNESDLDT